MPENQAKVMVEALLWLHESNLAAIRDAIEEYLESRR